MEENKKSDATDQGKTIESDTVASPANVSSSNPATKIKSDMDGAVGKGLTEDKSVKDGENPKDLKGSKKLGDKIKKVEKEEKERKKEKAKKAKKKADKKKKEKAKKEKAQKKLKEKKAKKKSAQKKKKSKK